MTVKTTPVYIKVEEIQPGEHGKNLYGKVLSSAISSIIANTGETLSVAEGQIGDETGVINFRVVGDYAKILIKDRVVAFRNCRSEVINERNRLQIDRWGKISNEALNIKSVKLDNNLSEVLYEKIVENPKQKQKINDHKRRPYNKGNQNQNHGQQKPRRPKQQNEQKEN